MVRRSTRSVRATVLALLVAAFALACSGGAAAPPAAGSPAEKPNFVYVMVDDMPPRGVMRAMPNVREGLIARGTAFPNAYVTQSTCCPSRASTLRGQYPHNTGVISTGGPGGGEPAFRPLEGSTVATWLDGAGYRTGLVGKYLNGYTGPHVPPGWDGWLAKGGVFGKPELVNSRGETRPFPDASTTSVYRPYAVNFVEKASAAGDPFALFLWTNAPHLPSPDYSARYADLYGKATLPKPPSFDEADVSDKPAWVRGLPRVDAAKRADLLRWHRQQLRGLREVDDAVGAMFDALRRSGELDETYFVFSADNGVHMGEHRWSNYRGAKNAPYEESASVPLIVRGPGVPAGVSRGQLVANNDLAPTIADLAGVDAPDFVDGRSLKPLLSPEPPEAWRSAILNERHLIEPDGQPSPDYSALLTGGETYVEYETGEQEYYDLSRDPYQLENAYPSLGEQERAGLSARLSALEDCAGESCRAAED